MTAKPSDEGRLTSVGVSLRAGVGRAAEWGSECLSICALYVFVSAQIGGVIQRHGLDYRKARSPWLRFVQIYPLLLLNDSPKANPYAGFFIVFTISLAML